MGGRGRVVTLPANRYLPRLSTGYRNERPAATLEPTDREAHARARAAI